MRCVRCAYSVYSEKCVKCKLGWCVLCRMGVDEVCTGSPVSMDGVVMDSVTSASCDALYCLLLICAVLYS